MRLFTYALIVLMAWAGFLPGMLCEAMAQSQSLDVLHWWTSEGERRAAYQLKAALEPAGVHWNDAAIPGGGGMAAVKVLKSRVLMGDPPDVAQLIGSTLTEWADMGLVLPLNAVAIRQKWSQTVFPLVMSIASYKGDVIAAPLGIHRINTLLVNRKLFDKFKLTPPENWAEFELVAKRFSEAGIKPLAWSDEPWQIATVFESLLLGEVGPSQYNDMIALRGSAGWTDPKVQRALQRLRWLRDISGGKPREQIWTDSARELMGDKAAMLIMGDWAYGELLAWGAKPRSEVGCTTVPGTAKMHLYSVDTLAMLVNARHRVGQQEKMAEILLNMNTQLAYNHVKGAVPVRRDLSVSSLASMDDCMRDSWETFANPDAARLPSLAHRMAADEATKDAIAQVLWRYATDSRVDVREVQKRLAALIRTP